MKYDIGYITNYVIEYDFGVPMLIIIGIFLIVCAIIVVLYHYCIDGFKFLREASWCFLGGYLSFLFCTTVLFRNQTEEMHYSFRPFLTYACLYNRRIAEIILNILMFIPIGFFSGIAIIKMNIIKVIGLGFSLSSSIEILQLLTRRGVCNVDDVIHNTLGCIIGYAFFVLCYKMVNKLRSVDLSSE